MPHRLSGWTTSIDEDLRNENASTDTEPGPQSGGRIFQERQHSLLASFATDKDARCGLKCQVVNAQADELGDSLTLPGKSGRVD